MRHALGLVDTRGSRWRELLWYVAGQFVVLSPLYFAMALRAAGTMARGAWNIGSAARKARARLVLLGTFPLFAYVGWLAWSGRAEANWTSAATVLLAAAWGIREAEIWRARHELRARAWVALGLAAVLTFAAHDVSLLWRLGWRWSDPTSDPTHRLHGWRELGLAAYEERQAMARAGAPFAPAITVDDYAIPAELAFYAPDHRMTWCPPIGRRHHQYDYWKQETPPPGGGGVWVSRREIPAGAPPRALFREWSGPRVVVVLDAPSGVERRRFYLYRCRGFTGAPPPAVQGW